MANIKREGRIATPGDFVYDDNPNVQEIYVDGISEGFIGFPVSKLTFHSALGMGPDHKERRVARVRIAIPTAALLELCKNFLEQGRAASSHFDEIQKVMTMQLRNAVAEPDGKSE